MFRKYFLPIFLVLASSLSACNGTTPIASESPAATAVIAESIDTAPMSVFPMTITDSSGREVTIDTEPARIISLSPSNTEIVFAIGAGSLVVGNTEYCDYPTEAVSITKVGGYSADSMSIETIVSLKPTCPLRVAC